MNNTDCDLVEIDQEEFYDCHEWDQVATEIIDPDYADLTINQLEEQVNLREKFLIMQRNLLVREQEKAQ